MASQHLCGREKSQKSQWELGIGIGQTWDEIPALPHTSPVTLRKFLHLSDLHFF